MRRWLIALAGLTLGSSALLAQPAREEAPAPPAAEADQRLERFTATRLTRFASEQELLAYLDAARFAARARGLWATGRAVQFASLRTDAQPAPVCPEDDPDCLSEDDAGVITVTGSRITRSQMSSTSPITSVTGAITGNNPSITNNQMAAVEEGDIVKQIDQFLIVLQDGRLFVIDTRAGPAGQLALTDRRDLYRSRHDVDWYDEMLVRGDRIIVAAYSYRQQATELSVLRLRAGGRLEPEGVFYMSSNDYYSTSNYATRIVGDNLVVYTPIALRELSAGRGWRWPVVRRWVDGEDRDESEARGRPLYDATTIYRPVRMTRAPFIHTISICPLSSVPSAAGLACRSVAFAAPGSAEFYVTGEHAYLWTAPGWTERPYTPSGEDQPACTARSATGGAPGALFRVPVAGGEPEVLGTLGAPINQFSLEASGGQFKALTLQQPSDCTPQGRYVPPLSYLSVPLDSFGPVLREAPRDAYTRLPSVGSRNIANRFADDYLVYGAFGQRAGRPATAFAVPVRRPDQPVRLDIPHNMIRVERAGPNMIATGYERGRGGLNISLIDLRGRPETASTLELDGRAESEGRSHAFNSLIERNGSGMMGLPTINARPDPRYPWRSEASDISFVSVTATGMLSDSGRLESRVPEREDEEVSHPSYSCEVSCTDWYGNSRPIFTDGRVFALTGNELIEGRVRNGRVRELRRLDTTSPVGTRSER